MSPPNKKQAEAYSRGTMWPLLTCGEVGWWLAGHMWPPMTFGPSPSLVFHGHMVFLLHPCLSPNVLEWGSFQMRAISSDSLYLRQDPVS